MFERLKAMRLRHTRLDAEIREEQRRPQPDPARLAFLKKLKLRLRDRIAVLERFLGAQTA